MGRKPIGDKPMTMAERQRKMRDARTQQTDAVIDALVSCVRLLNPEDGPLSKKAVEQARAALKPLGRWPLADEPTEAEPRLRGFTPEQERQADEFKRTFGRTPVTGSAE
jgi:hypothetical protein